MLLLMGREKWTCGRNVLPMSIEPLDGVWSVMVSGMSWLIVKDRLMVVSRPAASRARSFNVCEPGWTFDRSRLLLKLPPVDEKLIGMREPLSIW